MAGTEKNTDISGSKNSPLLANAGGGFFKYFLGIELLMYCLMYYIFVDLRFQVNHTLFINIGRILSSVSV